MLLNTVNYAGKGMENTEGTNEKICKFETLSGTVKMSIPTAGYYVTMQL